MGNEKQDRGKVVSALDMQKVQPPSAPSAKEEADEPIPPPKVPPPPPPPVASSQEDPPKGAGVAPLPDPEDEAEILRRLEEDMTPERARLILKLSKKAREMVGPDPNPDGSGGKLSGEDFYMVMATKQITWNGHVTILRAGKVIGSGGYGKKGIQNLKRQGVVMRGPLTAEDLEQHSEPV